MAAFNRHVFESLKHGALILFVDHPATPGSGTTDTAALHRIDEATVVEGVKAARFVLAGESDLLRNSADDHTKKRCPIPRRAERRISSFLSFANREDQIVDDSNALLSRVFH
jgi:predicted methyltransferase